MKSYGQDILAEMFVCLKRIFTLLKVNNKV